MSVPIAWLRHTYSRMVGREICPLTISTLGEISQQTAASVPIPKDLCLHHCLLMIATTLWFHTFNRKRCWWSDVGYTLLIYWLHLSTFFYNLGDDPPAAHSIFGISCHHHNCSAQWLVIKEASECSCPHISIQPG